MLAVTVWPGLSIGPGVCYTSSAFWHSRTAASASRSLAVATAALDATTMSAPAAAMGEGGSLKRTIWRVWVWGKQGHVGGGLVEEDYPEGKGG